jgi:hypothetical protein
VLGEQHPWPGPQPHPARHEDRHPHPPPGVQPTWVFQLSTLLHCPWTRKVSTEMGFVLPLTFDICSGGKDCQLAWLTGGSLQLHNFLACLTFSCQCSNVP